MNANDEVKTYSLSGAAEATGFSLGRFRYNRTKLEALGATINADGWSIPETALIQLGWLNPAKPAVAKKSKAQLLEEELKALLAENTELRRQLAEATAPRGLFGRKR